MKNQIATTFCFLAGLFSVILFAAPYAAAHSDHPRLYEHDATAVLQFSNFSNSHPGFTREDCESDQPLAHGHSNDQDAYVHVWYDAYGIAECQHSITSYGWFPELIPVLPVEPPVAAPPVSVSSGTPLVRTPGVIQSPIEPIGNADSELGVQSGSYAPADVQISPSAESNLPEYAAPAAIIGVLAFSSLYPDYELGSSFNYSGENADINWEAGMRGDFHHRSFSSYVSAVQSDNGFTVHSGTTYRSDSFLASYTTVEAKAYMNYAVQLSAPWKYSGWNISPNLSSQFHYDRDENHSSSETGAGLDLEYRF